MNFNNLTAEIDNIDFNKLNGLIPVCVQDYNSMQVLMLGFMNKEALELTIRDNKVTFWSRSRNEIWQKGETSGNYLSVINIALDCDKDSILILAKANGPTCHTGAVSCFDINDDEMPPLYYISLLNNIISDRFNNPKEGSYTNILFNSGTKRIAQKVAEEGVEVALAATVNDNDELANETADLIYHLLVLLKKQDLNIKVVTNILWQRHSK